MEVKHNSLESILRSLQNGETTLDQTLSALKNLPFQDLDFACLDNHRQLRQGAGEVVFAEGKSVEHLVAIIENLLNWNSRVLATRVSAEQAERLLEKLISARYIEEARVLIARSNPEVLDLTDHSGFSSFRVLLISAGTSDLPVIHECEAVLQFFGLFPEKLIDVGVAGIHRLLSRLEMLENCDGIIVAAGMDGALPSVVGGLVSCPVIAVPTSVGYGAAFGGISALLTMLNSCANGLTVVNIDSGFGAAMALLRVLNAQERRLKSI